MTFEDLLKYSEEDFWKIVDAVFNLKGSLRYSENAWNRRFFYLRKNREKARLEMIRRVAKHYNKTIADPIPDKLKLIIIKVRILK